MVDFQRLEPGVRAVLDTKWNSGGFNTTMEKYFGRVVTIHSNGARDKDDRSIQIYEDEQDWWWCASDFVCLEDDILPFEAAEVSDLLEVLA